MKKPTFVFDLGNVIAYYKPDEYLKRFGLEGERAAEFKRATFNDPVWLDCDAGLVTREDDFLRIAERNHDTEYNNLNREHTRAKAAHHGRLRLLLSVQHQRLGDGVHERL